MHNKEKITKYAYHLITVYHFREGERVRASPHNAQIRKNTHTHRLNTQSRTLVYMIAHSFPMLAALQCNIIHKRTHAYHTNPYSFIYTQKTTTIATTTKNRPFSCPAMTSLVLFAGRTCFAVANVVVVVVDLQLLSLLLAVVVAVCVVALGDAGDR